MADMPQTPPQGAPNPGGPQGAPPGAPTQPQQPQGNALQQLLKKQPPQNGSMSLYQMLLAFLAGAGAGPTVDNIKKLLGLAGRGAQGGNPNASHKAQGVQVAGSPNPGVRMTPSAQGQGSPPGGPQQPPGQNGPIPPALIARLLASQGQQQ